MKSEELDRCRQEALRRFGLIAPLLEENLNSFGEKRTWDRSKRCRKEPSGVG